MTDIIDNLFTSKRVDDTIVRPKTQLLDAVRQHVNNENSGVNVVYLESSHQTPTLSSVYLNGVEVSPSSSCFPSNAKVLISSNPVQDSIDLANQTHLSGCYVGDWSDPVFTMYRTYDENNCRAHLVLDRYPLKEHSFVAMVQSDPLFNSQSARDKLVKQSFNGVAIYNNKKRGGVTHPHGGYQFFFGCHKSRTQFMRTYAFRNQGVSTSDEVSSYEIFSCTYY